VADKQCNGNCGRYQACEDGFFFQQICDEVAGSYENKDRAVAGGIVGSSAVQFGGILESVKSAMTLVSLVFGTSLAATFGLFEIEVWWELASPTSLGNGSHFQAEHHDGDQQSDVQGILRYPPAAIQRVAECRFSQLANMSSVSTHTSTSLPLPPDATQCP
jgi:hypothetical protein